MHLHYALFAEVLRDLAKTVSLMPPNDVAHREALREAAGALYSALLTPSETMSPKRGSHQDTRQRGDGDISKMTPEEAVLLLHVME